MPDTLPELAGLPHLARIRAHEAFLMLLCMFAGVGGLFAPEANALNALLPPWFLWIWYGGLIVGALLGVTGMWLHAPTGPLIERAALQLLNGVSATYAAVLLYAAGMHGAPTASIVVLFVGFNVLRLYQIRIALAAQRAMLLAMRQARAPDDPQEQP